MGEATIPRYCVRAADDPLIPEADRKAGGFVVWDTELQVAHREDGQLVVHETEEAATAAADSMNAPTAAISPVLRDALTERYLAELKEPSRGQGLETLFKWALVLLILLAVAAAFISASFRAEAEFKTGAGELALSALGTLFIIALFVERAQQVYIYAWRGLDRLKVDRPVANLSAVLKDAEQSGDQERLSAAARQLADAMLIRERFRAQTRKIAFLGGMGIGIVIAWVGPRILGEIVSFNADLDGLHGVLFHSVDILITGGLIGGGSEGIHKVVVLITDFLDRTRERVNDGK